MKNTISFDNFAELDMRVGTIVAAEAIETADKLLKLTVDIGPSTSAKDKRDLRTIVAGIAEWYAPDELVGRQIPVLANLEPKILRGVESRGMMLACLATDESRLAASEEGKPILLSPKEEVAPGTTIR